MTSKSEAEHRKALRREAEKLARESEEARMPIAKDKLIELFDYLDVKLEGGCDHTLRLTRNFLQSQGLLEDTIVPWLGKYGGYCDCEILANVEEHWGQ